MSAADAAAGVPLTVAGAERAAVAAGLPRAEARYLLQALLGVSRAWLIGHDADVLDATAVERFHHWLARRLDGVPLAYLSGDKAFFGLTLRVTPDTLVPRPDTEVLVEWALERLERREAQRVARVVDLGTGTGAIALAIKSRRPDAEVRMVDASPGALAVALDNAGRLGLAVEGHLGSWFEPLAGQVAFDLIVSNPPYVSGDDHHLEALRHEPRMALTPEGDGLADLRHLVAEAPAWLRPDGWLLLEHGWDQAETVTALLRERGFADVENRRDLGGQPRVSGGRWPA
ncbi:peptide chain release factor N(5)-glutamine methyltransferase [Mitsuaria sp. GD03876]|uniref:peptide chain release factor N(5)-glutamine methyltransferase n=1 Tax=Mitsuaria sp. GD03876 TaxID=2975399 RepID=UPI00244833EF|nr:peptide chain release factor N(5)-glutamine methyltransferase [Mitsuaria sp. GD03876]MDH0867634.1 peptide chain release factor N(5)-glutamine methyltransferase [Mitsuaria sp. GD03876]